MFAQLCVSDNSSAGQLFSSSPAEPDDNCQELDRDLFVQRFVHFFPNDPSKLSDRNEDGHFLKSGWFPEWSSPSLKKSRDRFAALF